MKTFAIRLILVLITALSGPFLKAQWLEQPFPSNEYLWGVRFADESTGWIFGSDFVYGTSDGGVTWTVQDTTGNASFAFYTLNPTTAFYAAYPGGQSRGIRRTTNGGASWETVDPSSYYYTNIEFVTPEIGYAGGGFVSDFGAILRKTTDGGTTWFTVSTIGASGSYGEFEGLSFLSESVGWAITYKGTIYHTLDGGLTWIVQDSVTDVYSMRDIQFVTPDSGWAVGGLAGDMRIWRTTDEGNTWTKDIETGNSLREIQMLNSHTGWRVGMINGGPWIARTDDGGVTWSGQWDGPTDQGFESISMINEDLGWAVSWHAYKTTDGGVTAVEEPVQPTGFSLEQNYPNPFNPSTSISFSLQRSCIVSLKIFNLLGEEVATLVHEQKEAGPHTVHWDAGGRPSGVYFYRVKAENFSETRKLVIIR